MENKTLLISDLPPTVESVRPAKPQKTIQDWLRDDHARNELKRDVEQLKHGLSKVQLFLTVAVLLLVLTLIMQLLLWSAGL